VALSYPSSDSQRFLSNYVKIWQLVKRYKRGEIDRDSLAARKGVCRVAVTDFLISTYVLQRDVMGGMSPSVYQAQFISQKCFCVETINNNCFVSI
jgi:hypothetical protein